MHPARSTRIAGAVVAASLLTVTVVVSPAAAETRTVRDQAMKPMQGPANQLLSATFRFAGDKIVWKVRLKRLNERTRVYGTVFYDRDSYVRVRSVQRDGSPVVHGWVHDGSTRARIASGLGTRWDTERSVVRIAMTRPGFRAVPRANFDAFTVARGAMHGPHCPIDVETAEIEPCNDDYVYAARVRRGGRS